MNSPIVLCEVIEAARKSTSSSSNNSIPGLIFEAAEIHRFRARSADKYLGIIFQMIIFVLPVVLIPA